MSARNVSTLAMLRTIHADRQTPRLANAFRGVIEKHVREFAAHVAAGGGGRIGAAALKRWAADITNAQRVPLAYMAKHGFDLAGAEVAALPRTSKSEARRLEVVWRRSREQHGKASIGGVNVGDDPSHFLLSADWTDLNKWVATTAESASATTGTRLQNIFERASSTFDQDKQQGITPKQIAEQILSEGITQCTARAAMLAQTGAIWAYGEGATQRYAAEGIEVQEWLTADDDLRCPFCAEMNAKRVGVGDPFFQSGDTFSIQGSGTLKIPGGVRGFDVKHPPLHPNCRCTLVPIVDEGQLDADRLAVVAPVATMSAPIKGTLKPGQPSLLPKPSDPFKAIVRNIEDDIVQQPNEVSVVLDVKGNEVLRKAGGVDMVGITPAELAQMNDATVTHNHTVVGSFSPDDVKLLFRAQAKEVRAVDAKYAYSVSRKPGVTTLDEVKFDKAHTKAFVRAAGSFRDEYTAGKMTLPEITSEATHLAMESLEASNEYGIVYSREAR